MWIHFLGIFECHFDFDIWEYTVVHCAQNIKNTFLILSCNPTPNPFALRRASIPSGHGLRKVSKSVPQLCEVGWMSIGRGTTRDTVEREKPSSVAVLDTNRCAWRLPPDPVQRHLCLVSCPFTLWMAHTHTQPMSQLSQGLKLLL